MAYALFALLAALGTALAAAVLRAIATPRAAPPSPPLPDSALAEAAGVEEKLAAALRRATVSSFDPGKEDGEAFKALKRDLAALFPRVHAELGREELGDRALLFRWEGSDPSLAPAILCAHFDVVPADDAAEWRHGPFSGDIAEGAVWGRGAQDIKVCLVSALDAAERLLAAGRRPRRTVYFAFGGDEEVGGNRGAASIAKALAARGVRASFLLDEGGPIADGMLSFADRPLALVGIAEKGYVDARLETRGRGGHASMPPRRSAAGDLARAVAAVEARPAPARLGFTVRSFLDRLAPFCPFAYKLLFRNLWLASPLVKAAFGAAPTTNALVRTTAAPTMLEGSPKENVLADRARANVNMRILPGETVAEALGRLSRTVARHGALVSVAHEDHVVEPLPESPVDHEGYRAIEAALGASFPEAAAVPFLFSAGTDTKHYREVADAIYRLTPLKQTGADLAGVHGRDERVEVGNLRRCAIFYRRLLEAL